MGKHVAILLCTYNGAIYLQEQLDSYLTQTHTDWSLHVNDDGSTDGTLKLLNRFKENNPDKEINIYQGPKRGFARNFLDLTFNPDVQADYYAYSDHDDIWYPEKIERALSQLEDLPVDLPVLYCSRSEYVDGQGVHMGYSSKFTKPTSFSNALAQSIAGGNTMVFNKATRHIMLSAGERDIPSHDWWVYQLVSGAGGKVIYDAKPNIGYRQHGANVIGSNRGLSAIIYRIKHLMAGRFRHWNDMNCRNLHEVSHLLIKENLVLLEHFSVARNSSLIHRIVNFGKSGIYRQTFLGNAGLIVAAFLKRI